MQRINLKRSVATRNIKKNLITHSIKLAAILSVSIPASTALAQPQRSAQALEEIIVTARKRLENLQKVPMAMSAFTGEDLKNAGIDDITDLGRLTSNITLNETSGLQSGSVQIFIRGIGNDPGFSQGVGIYVDDVYLNRSTGSLLEVYDIERIEILKGPQGNLYGRNTIGGAIKYISREPSEEFRANMEAKVGNYGLVKLKGGLSGELIPGTLYGGFGFSSKERDGIQTNSFNGEKYNSADNQAFRGTLLFTPAEDLSIKLTADYSNNDSSPTIPNRVAVDEAALDQFSFLLTGADLFFGEGTALHRTPNDTSLPSDVDQVNTDFVDGFDKFKIETKSLSLTVEYDINDEFVFKSVTSQRYVDTNLAYDFDGTDQHFITTTNFREYDDFSQEFQLNYSGETVNGVLGLYYLDGEKVNGEAGTTFQTTRLRLITDQIKIKPVDTRTVESKSIYGTVDWEFQEDWELSVGARYTEDSKSLDQVADVTQRIYATAFSDYAPGALLVIAPGMEAQVEASPSFAGWLSNSRYMEISYDENVKNDDSWSEFSPSVRLTHHINPDVMVYGGLASGFKAGGLSTSGGQMTNYDPETVETYTLGVKSTLLDGTMRLNLEYFYNDYTDKQLATIALVDGSLVQSNQNVGEVTSDGAELELHWQTPVEGLLFNMNVGYLNSEINKFPSFDDDDNPIDLSSVRELGFAPKWTAQARIMYDVNVADMGTLSLGTDVSYRTQSFTDSPVDTTSEFLSSAVSEEYALWNALVSFRTTDDHWRIALEGKNLEDKRVLVNTFNVSSFVTGGYNMPRTWALSVGYTF